jgi:hypothetical protein
VIGAAVTSAVLLAGAFALASLRHDIPALWQAARRICEELNRDG